MENPDFYIESIKNIFDNLNENAIIINKDFRIEWINNSLESKGFKLEDIRGREFFRVFDNLDSIPEDDPTKLAFETKEVQKIVKKGSDGNDYEIISIPIKENDEIVYVLELSRNLSETKKVGQDSISERNFSDSIINNLADGFAAVDASGKQIIVNDKLCEMTGFSKEELIGKKAPFKYWAEENLDKIDYAFKQTLKGVSKDWELIFKRKNGERFYALVSPTKIKDPEGNTIFIATIKNTTERKKYEEKLNNYKILFDNINDCAYICDAKGNVLFVNKILEKLAGYKPEELIGKPFAPLFDQENLKKAVDVYNRTLKGESTQCELTFKKTGIICEYKNEPLYDKNKKIIGTMGILRDITEKRKSEEEIKNLNKINQEIINGIEEAICLIDPKNFDIISANNFFYNEYGLKKEDVIGKKCYFITHHRDKPCKPPNDICPLKEALNTGKLSRVEHIHFDKNNKKKYVEILAYPIKDEEGKVSSIVHIARDITERKKAEEEIKKEKEFSENILNSMSDGLDIVGEDYKIQFMNKAFMDAFGKDAIGKKCYEVYKENKKQCKLCPLKKKIKVGETRTIEVPGIIGGKTFLISYTGLKNEDGSLSILEIFKDITQRKKYEEQLHQKVGELEKFHKLAVGRELRMIELMIELKKRIKELENNLRKE
jgi:PAS domain S-box-containing protein